MNIHVKIPHFRVLAHTSHHLKKKWGKLRQLFRTSLCAIDSLKFYAI